MNDPELKAMSVVFDALKDLDGETRRRVTIWVLAKLESSDPVYTAIKSKIKRAATGKKRGPKPGSKRAGRKRGRKPGSTVAARKTGRRGRPPGSGKKAVAKSTGRKRGRPRKSAAAASAA